MAGVKVVEEEKPKRPKSALYEKDRRCAPREKKDPEQPKSGPEKTQKQVQLNKKDRKTDDTSSKSQKIIINIEESGLPEEQPKSETEKVQKQVQLNKKDGKTDDTSSKAQKIVNDIEESDFSEANIGKKQTKAKNSSKKRTSNKTTRVLNDGDKSGPKQSTITQHFQVRRSERKPKCLVEKEAKKAFEERVLSGDENNLEVRTIEGKGRGVFSKLPLKRGDLVCEYAGDLISFEEAQEREREYGANPEIGCYMYYFEYAGKKYCVDATKETDKLGRLLNHSKTNANVYTRLFPIKNKPYLILVASRDIKFNEELLYDYGDRSKSAIESHPWLKS